MKIAFITGITGQDGSYLAEFLLEKNYKIYGIQRRTSRFNTTRIDNIKSKLIMRYGDLTDSSGLNNFLFKIIEENPDLEILELYNLAAQSHVKISFEIPEYTANVDGLGTMRLLEIVRSFPENIRKKVRFYQAGTSEMYGKVLQIPQDENTPFNPVSPYAAAKVYSYYMVKCYREGYNLFATNGILFNHESPRRGKNFVTMKIITAVKEICKGTKEFVSLGNLDSKRDWGHAKDYIKGMWLMLQQDKPDDFVLATGNTYTVREFVERAFAFKGFKISWAGSGEDEIGVDQNNITRVKINPKYYRPCEVDLLLGNPEKAIKILNWNIEFDTLDKLIEDMF